MCNKTRKDKIRNECFRKHLGLGSIDDILGEICLRWFEHVQRRLATALLTKCFSIQVDGPQG